MLGNVVEARWSSLSSEHSKSKSKAIPVTGLGGL
jgi:hypothetical protein